MNQFTWTFLAVLALVTAIELWLSLRQSRYVQAHRHSVPNAFKNQIDLAAHQKAADYTVAKGRFNRASSIFSVAVLLIWTLGGGLNLLTDGWQSLGWSNTLTGISLIVSFLILSRLIELPLSWYKTFVLEEQFGFNNATVKLFITDIAKQGALTLVLGIPFIWAALFLISNAGNYWWFYLWLGWVGFSVLMMWAYPTFIAPLFNTFTPLEDARLTMQIEDLLSRCGFKSQGIYVMNGSLRSGHGNAYFTGLGNNKRIVFFDTLLETLNANQIEAVLAHELGHFRHKHIVKNMALIATLSLIGLAILGWASAKVWFYTGLGVASQTNAVALILFVMIVPVFGFFLQPLIAALSRKYEYEADDYAASVSSSNDLITALVTLYQENASTLTPDPLVSAVYDSHPPATLRVNHLQANSAD